MPIELINTTPWDTEGLTKFLVPLCADTGIETLKVSLLLAQPGQRRADQPLYEICGINFSALKQEKLPTKATVQIISPKRAAARTDLLDRMALIEDLAVHEIALPETIAEGIAHAFERLGYVCRQKTAHARQMAVGDEWVFRRHFGGERYQICECHKTLKVYPFIRGNTKTRTLPLVDINKLKRRGRWALESAEKHREKMEKELALAQRLGVRISKLEAKAWDDASKGKGH